jgi:hypothetical protein
MDAASARKKPPETLCPRGAKDTTHSRERLDAPQSPRPAPGRRGGALLVCPKRAAGIRANGQTLRGPQESRRDGTPGADPSTWINP